MSEKTVSHTPEKTDTRTQLILCAFDLFSQRGIDKVNMDAIATAAQVTKGSLYWHFSSKKEVIAAACGHYYENWKIRIHAALEEARTPREKLEAAIRYSVRSCLFDERNRVFTMEVLTLSLYDETIRSGWAQFLDVVREFFIGLTRDARDAGQLDCANPERAVEFMLSAMEGFKLQAIFDPRICSRIGEQNICHGLMEALRNLRSA